MLIFKFYENHPQDLACVSYAILKQKLVLWKDELQNAKYFLF